MKIQSAMRAVAMVAVVFWSQMIWAQAKPDAKPAAGAPAKADPVLEDAVPGSARTNWAAGRTWKRCCAGTWARGPATRRRSRSGPMTTSTAIRVGDLYKNEEAAYKIVAIKKQTAKGGEFTVERIAGQSDPQRRWNLVSAKEKTAPRSSSHTSRCWIFTCRRPVAAPHRVLFVAMMF